MISTSLVSQAWIASARARLKAALSGLEKLSDAEAAAYLTAHPSAVQLCALMPTTFTAAMVHEARNS